MSRQEIVAMLPKDSIGAEIGVWKGDFSAEIIEGAKPRKLHLIDPWVIKTDESHKRAWYGNARKVNMDEIYDGVRRRFEREVASGTCELHRALSHEALATFPDGHFDFIYIDGDHHYDQVHKDCFMAFDKVRVGGLIGGDDYSLGSWWGNGVVRAFHELLYHRNVILRYAKGSQIVVEKLANSA